MDRNNGGKIARMTQFLPLAGPNPFQVFGLLGDQQK